MKTSSVNLLTVSAAFFALCASGMAAGPKSIIQTACIKCHGGGSVSGDLDFTQVLTREQKIEAITKVAQGEMPLNGPKLTSEQVSQLEKELGFNAATASSEPSAAPPEAPPVVALPKKPTPKRGSLKPPTKPVVKSQAVAADTLKGDDVEKLLDLVSSVKGDSAKKSDSSKSLKGDRMTASRKGAGEPIMVELQMDDNSWEKLTIPGADDESSTTTRKEEVEYN